MAEIQRTSDDFSGAETSATEAYENCVNPTYLPYVYNTLGIVYKELYNYDESLKYYNKCYAVSSSEMDKCIVKNNIAVVYLDQNKYKKAIAILEKLATNDTLKKSEQDYARALDNLGYAYFKTNSPFALSYLNTAYDIRSKINPNRNSISSSIHLAEFYQHMGMRAMAFNYAKQSYDVAAKFHNPDNKIAALKFMIINGSPLEIKKLALRQMELSDSIKRVRQSAKNQFAKIKYDSSKAIKEKELSEQQKRTITIAFVLVTIASLVVIFVVRYRNRQKLKTSVYDTEIRIAKKIHDELANDVFQAMNYAENQDLQNPVNKEVLLQDLDTIYTKTRNISQSNSDIDTGENFRNALLQLLNSHSNEKVNVIIKNYDGVDWKISKIEIKTAVYRVLQELMVNMKKHSQASLVIISFDNHPKYFEISYSDNGKGSNQFQHHKKGLHNTENRIHAIKGTITFESEANKGFRAKITIQK